MDNQETFDALVRACREYRDLGNSDDLKYEPGGNYSLWSDWQAYLPEVVCEQWESLPVEAKLVAYLMANSLLSNVDSVREFD